MRLIDADELQHRFYEEEYDVQSYFDDGFSYEKVCDLIESQPTINPVKNGRWNYDDVAGEYHCCYCGYVPEGLELYGGECHYCQNCGAKMEVLNDEAD